MRGVPFSEIGAEARAIGAVPLLGADELNGPRASSTLAKVSASWFTSPLANRVQDQISAYQKGQPGPQNNANRVQINRSGIVLAILLRASGRFSRYGKASTFGGPLAVSRQPAVSFNSRQAERTAVATAARV